MAGFKSTGTAFWTMPVSVVPYSTEWPDKFVLFLACDDPSFIVLTLLLCIYNIENEKKLLLKTIPDIVVEVEHFGSTSVPEMAAKPIIDIQAAVSRMPNAQELAALSSIGYQERALDTPVAGYMRFDKGQPVVTSCLHLKQDQAPGVRTNGWYDALVVRDYLRCHPEDRELYSRTKGELASQEGISMIAYRLGKTNVLNAIGDRASKWSQENQVSHNQ